MSDDRDGPNNFPLHHTVMHSEHGLSDVRASELNLWTILEDYRRIPDREYAFQETVVGLLKLIAILLIKLAYKNYYDKKV